MRGVDQEKTFWLAVLFLIVGVPLFFALRPTIARLTRSGWARLALACWAAWTVRTWLRIEEDDYRWHLDAYVRFGLEGIAGPAAALGVVRWIIRGFEGPLQPARTVPAVAHHELDPAVLATDDDVARWYALQNDEETMSIATLLGFSLRESLSAKGASDPNRVAVMVMRQVFLAKQARGDAQRSAQAVLDGVRMKLQSDAAFARRYSDYVDREMRKVARMAADDVDLG